MKNIEIKQVKGFQAFEDDIRNSFNATLSETKGTNVAQLWNDAKENKDVIWKNIENTAWDEHRAAMTPKIQANQRTFTVTENQPVQAKAPDGSPFTYNNPVSTQVTRTDPIAQVDTRPALKGAQKVLDNLEAINNSDLTPSSIGYKLEAVSTIKQLLKQPENLEFDTAHKLQSLLGRMERQMTANQELAARNIRAFRGNILDEMGETAKRLGEEQSWMKARTLTKLRHERLDNGLFNSVNNAAANNPDSVRNILAGNDTPIKMQEVRKIMGARQLDEDGHLVSTDNWQKVQAVGISDMLTAASKPVAGFTGTIADGRALKNVLKQKGGSIDIMLDPEMKTAMNNYANLAFSVQSKHPEMFEEAGALERVGDVKNALGRSKSGKFRTASYASIGGKENSD